MLHGYVPICGERTGRTGTTRRCIRTADRDPEYARSSDRGGGPRLGGAAAAPGRDRTRTERAGHDLPGERRGPRPTVPDGRAAANHDRDSNGNALVPGLEQRALALDAFIADVYSERDVVARRDHARGGDRPRPGVARQRSLRSESRCAGAYLRRRPGVFRDRSLAGAGGQSASALRHRLRHGQPRTHDRRGRRHPDAAGARCVGNAGHDPGYAARRRAARRARRVSASPCSARAGRTRRGSSTR